MRQLVLLVLILSCLVPGSVIAQEEKEQKPAVPLEKWTGKTIMLIGAHADDILPFVEEPAVAGVIGKVCGNEETIDKVSADMGRD